METIGKIRHRKLVKNENISEIARELNLSRNTAKKYLNADREAQITQATQTAVLDNQKFYQRMFSPITSAFDTSIKGFIMGTQTWQQAWQRSLVSILSSFIDTGIKMVSTWASQQLAMTLATTAQNDVRMTSNQMASTSSLATSALTIVKSIMNSASETFAGIFGFLAPTMGPYAAAPAAVGMGAVAAVAGSVASSAGGDKPLEGVVRGAPFRSPSRMQAWLQWE